MAKDYGLDTGYVILGGGMHTIAVDQGGSIAFVQASRISYYDPRISQAQERRLLYDALRPQQRATPHGMKFCSACGDWVSQRGFAADKRNRDGLQSHCRECQNDHKRRMYELVRAEQGYDVRAYKRRERVIEVDFTSAGQATKAA